mmetsp:Transcript_8059/g.10282  ORF Transcript_8059/g.10282 Transcript_8059/m.10282 type:complete len:83 (-) Transcript_8059:1482-1730(-)
MSFSTSFSTAAEEDALHRIIDPFNIKTSYSSSFAEKYKKKKKKAIDLVDLTLSSEEEEDDEKRDCGKDDQAHRRRMDTFFVE